MKIQLKIKGKTKMCLGWNYFTAVSTLNEAVIGTQQGDLSASGNIPLRFSLGANRDFFSEMSMI